MASSSRVHYVGVHEPGQVTAVADVALVRVFRLRRVGLAAVL